MTQSDPSDVHGVGRLVQYGGRTRGRGRVMAGASAVTETLVEEMSVEEGRRMLDGLTQDRLGIAREEFLRRLDAGEYAGTDSEDVIRLRMLAPFGR